MLEEKASNIKKIYVPFLNEGTNVLRPAQGIQIAPNKFRILETTDYDAEDEEWQFLPGSLVECQEEVREGGKILVAKRLIER